MTRPATSVAYFGPVGTFTEEALLTQPDYAAAALEPRATITDVLEAVASGEVDLGFVPIENAIEGTVNDTLDALIFDFDLLIQREVVLDIHLHLMAPPGTELAEVRRVLSFPVALAQCRKYLAEQPARRPSRWPPTRPPTPPVSSASTPSRARRPSPRGWPPTSTACRSWPRTWRTIPDNQTRFVAVAPIGDPGADRPRPDQHRLLPAGRPPGQPARDPRPVRRPQHQPDQAGVAADQAGPG